VPRRRGVEAMLRDDHELRAITAPLFDALYE
jgi:hypothetical protein